jgi:hypothetical protein
MILDTQINECGFRISDFGIKIHESKNGGRYWILETGCWIEQTKYEKKD